MNRRRVGAFVRVWNRKLHYYVGLYLILFLWLFSFSGLLLNHSAWGFAQFWPQRNVTTTEQRVNLASDATDIAVAESLMRQLDLTGELEWTKRLPQENRLQIRAGRPGETITVTVDLASSLAAVETIRVNGWGVIRSLHTFTGLNDPKRQSRDWLPTILWSVSMDALSLGAIFLVLSSIYMWYLLKPKRRPGLVALSIGLIACGFFVFGLARLF